MTVGRTAAQQQLAARGPGGGMGNGEAAVVADALNDVMGKMLTVVSKKTRGYVGATYKRTEDRLAARLKSMEEKISGFEQVRADPAQLGCVCGGGDWLYTVLVVLAKHIILHTHPHTPTNTCLGGGPDAGAAAAEPGARHGHAQREALAAAEQARLRGHPAGGGGTSARARGGDGRGGCACRGMMMMEVVVVVGK